MATREVARSPEDSLAAVTVPFVDLRPQHEEIRAELDAAIERVIDSCAFVGGAAVEVFERSFADFCGTGYAVGVGSGTDALRIALQAVGVERGDSVVTVSHTFIATAEAITQVGATPVFVDIERDAHTLSPEALRRFLDGSCERGEDGRPRLRETGSVVAAIVPVHLYGQSADMAPILEHADAYGIPVVEDACQAHGASYRFPDGREARCGSMGRAAAFSFYPGKNLGAMGEAGAITTNEGGVAERARVLRDHGQTEKYVHATAEGSNARLDAIQASALSLKLARLEEWNERRRDLARRYDEGLRQVGIPFVPEVGRGRHVYHLYVVRLRERDAVREALAANRVHTGLHYPIPVHLQDAYRHLGYGPASLPESEEAAATVLSLPMYPHMTPEMVDVVVERLAGEAGR